MLFALSRSQLIQRGERVRAFRLPNVASLYGVHQDRARPAELLGTGTFVQHRDDVFVLTAMHVVKESKKYAYVFHDLGGDGENMIPCRSGWTGLEGESGDLALWGCFPEPFKASGPRPLPFVEPFGVTDASEDAFFIASGWPEALATPFPYLRKYLTKLHTIMGKAIVHDDIPARSFAFTCANDIPYFGMSGSAVWNLNLHLCKNAEDWTPQMSTFAGVVVGWMKEKGLIIATRAEVVKDFLSGAIERLR